MKRLILLFLIGLLFSRAEAQEEWIKVYFNMPTDSTVASNGNQANDEWDLIGSLEVLIDAANHSVDLCIYDLEHHRIAEALVRAKERGVRVRIVTDNKNRTDGKELDELIWKMLAEADISSIDDDGDVYSEDGIEDNDLVGDSYDMHHKFAVIDFMSEEEGDDYVWTGSTNLTYTGAFNTNHTIVIKGHEVAEAYLLEFEQMWGDDDDDPDPDDARFHKDKKELGEHIFDVGGTRLELYFAPVDRDKKKPSISDRIVKLIDEEVQSDINFQAFAFTPTISIAQKIWEKTNDTSIQLMGAIDPGFYSRYRKAGQIWGSSEAQSANRYVAPAREMRKLHHKMLILDATNDGEGDKGVVVTGSYNFSNNAELNNDENLLIIYSDEIANQFYQDMSATIKRAKGEIEAPAPPLDLNTWYEISSVRSGDTFEIEIAPGFDYPVRLLGVDAPRLFVGADSADYYSSESYAYLKNLLDNVEVRLSGPGNKLPENRRGAFRAYVEMMKDGSVSSVNSQVLTTGNGRFSNYYSQHPDSVKLFKQLETISASRGFGMWQNTEQVGKRITRPVDGNSRSNVINAFPININTADQATLELLPGIGPTYAKRIIEFRDINGPYASKEDIMNVKGIGEGRFDKIKDLIKLN